MFVKLWMHSGVITVLPDQTLAEADDLMTSNRIRRLPVVDQEMKILGIITREDVKNGLPSIVDVTLDETTRALARQAKIESFMTKTVIKATPADTLEKVAMTMQKHKIGGIPVVEEDRLIGIITESDIFKAFAEILGGNENSTRIELIADQGKDTFYSIIDICKTHDIEIENIALCNNYSTQSRAIILRITGQNIEPLVDALWKTGCKINSVISGTPR
ncbi:CBS domain-containing protein [Desulfosediminicola flagellatus]|uniref:CBS domain-containing protein n=1 Tax=Desulfosediminicola flagellatus TaxID=2569541 RepID=UPI0010ABD61B|nr:CBS domain-containing protein [Desulfosediminicola flagellatus]